MDETRFDRYFELLQAQILELRTEMRAGFERIDRRFDDVYRRFDEVDRRFDDVYRRFDEIDRRFDEVDRRFDQSAIDWNERFQSVLDRLDLLEQRVEKSVNAIGEMRSQIDDVKAAIYTLDTRVDRLQMSVNGLSDDMRQRLRALNERIAGVEKRLAA